MRRLVGVLIALLVLGAVLPQDADATLVVSPHAVALYQVGQAPFGVVADPADGRVYVANSGSRTIFGGGFISVVDPTTGLVSTIATSKPSGFLALDSAARRLYSSNWDPATDAKSLDEIDLSTRSVIATLPIGGLAVVVDPSLSRLFVAAGQTLFSVDTTTFSVASARSTPSDQNWFGLALDPALHQLYVTNIFNSHPSVTVLDEYDLSTIAGIALATVPRFAIAVDTDTHRVFVAGSDPSGPPFGGSAIYAIDGVSHAVVASAGLAGFPGGIALVPSTQRLYVTDMYTFVQEPLYGRPINELDMTTLTVTNRLVADGEPALAALAPDNRLWVTLDKAGAVAVYDMTPRNLAPVIDHVTVTPMEAKTNDVLTTSVIAHDPNGDPITVSYQWYVNTTNTAGQQQSIPGETSPTLDLSKPGNGDREDLICIGITVSDGTLQTSTLWCFLFVQDSAPIASVALAPTAPTRTSVVQATASATDADGDVVAYRYAWSVNGAVRRVTTTSSSFDVFDLATVDGGVRGGDVVSVEVVASDDLLSGPPASASVSVANTAPIAAVALSDSTPKKRDVLVAAVTATDADSDALTYAYTWRVNGKLKQTSTGGATSSSFDLRAAETEVGDLVTVDIVVSDGVATAAASASATVTPAGH